MRNDYNDSVAELASSFRKRLAQNKDKTAQSQNLSENSSDVINGKITAETLYELSPNRPNPPIQRVGAHWLFSDNFGGSF